MNKKLLVVEDHDGLRLLLSTYLSKSYEVASAKNGLEAMSWLAKGFIPDAIITDSQMPEFSGRQLLVNLRCSGLYRHIPVVVISGSEAEGEERKFLQLGAREFIRKPFNPVQLTERLAHITRPAVLASARMA